MQTKHLPTFDEYQNHGAATGYDGWSNYMGDRSIAPMLVMPVIRTRDSGALEESNFAAALKDLGGESDAVQVHRFGSWTCGWYELILIDPNNAEAVDGAKNIAQRLDDYPILDESDFSERERAEADDVWAHGYDWRERVEYIRKHRSQFEPHDLADLLGCVRGKYFLGYARELIY